MIEVFEIVGTLGAFRAHPAAEHRARTWNPGRRIGPAHVAIERRRGRPRPWRVVLIRASEPPPPPEDGWR